MTSDPGIVSDGKGSTDEAILIEDSSMESGREGTVDIRLLLDGQCVSSCRIIPMQIRIGAAAVRMDGIGIVETAAGYRQRGFARRVLNAALRRMQDGDAAITMLYGITNFYPKFGYVTVGPESTIALPPQGGEAALAERYEVRHFTLHDLPRVQDLYDRATARGVGTALRPRDRYPWTVLLDTLDADVSRDCVVILNANGEVTGYVWRGEGLPFVRAHSGFNPDDLVLAEAVAGDPRSADAALAVCRRWAADERTRRGREVRRVTLFLPHDGHVAAAAMQVPATLARSYGPDGGWMARILSTDRLLASMQPELSRRLVNAERRFRGTLRVQTEMGEATLRIDGADVRVHRAEDGAAPPPDGENVTWRIPQTTLVRLALGSFPPDDLLARLPDPPDERVATLVRTMFPPRPAQIFLADRF